MVWFFINVLQDLHAHTLHVPPSAGTVKDVQLAGASTDQMALVEYGTLIEAQTALKLNGMKIGDAYTLQVRDRAAIEKCSMYVRWMERVGNGPMTRVGNVPQKRVADSLKR